MLTSPEILIPARLRKSLVLRIGPFVHKVGKLLRERVLGQQGLRLPNGDKHADGHHAIGEHIEAGHGDVRKNVFADSAEPAHRKISREIVLVVGRATFCLQVEDGAWEILRRTAPLASLSVPHRTDLFGKSQFFCIAVVSIILGNYLL